MHAASSGTRDSPIFILIVGEPRAFSLSNVLSYMISLGEAYTVKLLSVSYLHYCYRVDKAPNFV